MSTPIVDAQPLIDAVKAAVSAGGAAGVPVDVGRKPANATTRWIVLWPDTGTVDDRSLKSRDGWSIVLPAQCYGLTPEAAAYAVRKYGAAILGLHGTVVAGRTVHMPVHERPPPLSRDDDADPPIFMQYDEWRIRTS